MVRLWFNSVLVLSLSEPYLISLQTMVTPLTQRYFGFGELGNSVMYSLCGVEVIGGFFLVRWLSRVLEDRAVLAVGLLICCGACVWCIIFLASPQGECMRRDGTIVSGCVSRDRD